MKLSLALAALLPLVSYAADIPVAVGQSGLTFVPSSVTAAEGDVVVFSFYPKNHTVTQSTFAAPCTALAGGADSEFVGVASADTPTVWNYTVANASAPLWFHCAQTAPVNHCTSGMVFAINPSATKTFAEFQDAAKGVTASNGTTTGAGTATGASTARPSTTGAATPSSGALQIASTGAASILAIAGVVAGFAL